MNNTTPTPVNAKAIPEIIEFPPKMRLSGRVCARCIARGMKAELLHRKSRLFCCVKGTVIKAKETCERYKHSQIAKVTASGIVAFLDEQKTGVAVDIAIKPAERSMNITREITRAELGRGFHGN